MCDGVGVGGVGGWWGCVVVRAVLAVGGGHVWAVKKLGACWSAAEPTNCGEDDGGCAVQDVVMYSDAVLVEFFE